MGLFKCNVIALLFSALLPIRLKTLKRHARTRIWGNKRPYQKSVFWVIFSMLGTKTINMWESKRKLLKTCLLSLLRNKTLKLMQTNQYDEAEKHYQKYIFWVFELVTYIKNTKLIQNTLYWETKGHCEKSV